ncbi:MAG: hypothetical protein R3232_08420, partial [Clostridia bacterium]|nr:hypothetical protein [Clostridia bacterium]
RPKYEGRFPVQSKTFLVNQSEKMAKEAFIGQLVNNEKSNINMDDGYFILGKKQLIIGFGIAVVLIIILCAFLISIKNRKARTAERN